MRLKYSKEDYIIAFFILLGLLYPLFTALLIFLEDVKEKREELEQIRAFYGFLLGLEDCRKERAEELALLMSEELSKDMGGAEGLLKKCQSYRKAYAGVRAEERFIKEGELKVELLRKEKGMTNRLVSLHIRYSKGEEGIRVKSLEYEKGS
jgi:hypothetical protein